MSQVINTNVMSLNAQRNLSTSGGSLATALQRLSSGLRINSAKDDAAGLAISERLTTQIRGLNQAARNASDGISLSQTAEGGLSTVGDLLQRMRELAVQSANSTNSSSDRQSLQREVSQLQQEVARIATSTNFNGQRLLDGSLTGAQFQVGANANQTIQISIGSVRGTDIGNYRLRSTGDNANATALAADRAASPNSVLTTEVLTISGNGTSVTVTPGAAGESAKAIADRVNSAVSATGQSTGVTAFAQTKATLSGMSAGTVAFNLYGQNTAALAISATVTGSDVSALATAVNAQSASTGITASANGGTLTFTSAEGYDVSIENYTNTGGGTASLQGLNPFTDAVSGSAVALTAATATTDSSTVGGMIQFNGSSGYTVTSAVAGALFGATTANASSLTAVSAIDVSTVSGANDAIRIVDSALTATNNLRADLGAVQNRFTQTINSLQTASENLSAARSRILDADFASETAMLTRAQILQQAGVAILSQANAVPQNVLSLLR
jgi:flagellin